MTHPALSKILEAIFNDACKVFKDLDDFNKTNLQIILVAYNKTKDSVVFWDLYKDEKYKVEKLSTINIRNGDGTVGFIVRSKKPEMVGNTFEDPRGSVALADFFIGNKSFFGIPVIDANELKFIISFSYNGENIWHKSNNKQIINSIEKIIKKKYKKELLLLNEIQIQNKIHKVFVEDGSDSLSLLNRMVNIINETVDYSFLAYSQNNRILQIKINDSIIENRIFTFLNWCSLFDNKCTNCPIISTECKNDNCIYYTDFLQYLEDYKVIEIPLDIDKFFVLKLYCKEDIEAKSIKEEFKILFSPIIDLFKNNGINLVQKKILAEVIHQIISNYTTFLIDSDEAKIGKIAFEDYIKIIKSYFSSDIELKSKDFNNLFKSLSEKIKNGLLLIELWQNNIKGIKISKITCNSNKNDDVNSYRDLDKDLPETATVKVLINPDSIPDKANIETILYKPLIASNSNESIYKVSTKYVIQKEGISQFEIEWENNPNLSQLIRIQINQLYLEQYLKSKYSAYELQTKFKENKFFGFKELKSPKNDDTELNLEISLALNTKIIEKDTIKTIDQFAKNVYQTELKHIANTRSAIADIINRNYAHHIGSHVSNRATFERILQKLDIDDVNSITSEHIASIAGMRSTLEKYKDERSEFIASITNSQVSQSFMFYNDIIRPFVENTLLVDNIAANEGIGYFAKNGNSFDRNTQNPDYKKDTLSQLVIRVFIHNDILNQCESNNSAENSSSKYYISRDPLSEPPKGFSEQKVIYFIDQNKEKYFDSLSIPYYLIKTDLENKFYDSLETVLPDIEISLPGGLGKHLLYSFLENYIRNTAKHAYKEEKDKGKPVEIILKLMPSDNIDDGKIKLEITRNLKEEDAETTLGSLNDKIKTRLSEKQGMGIADMKICACLIDEKELTEDNLANSIKAINRNGAIGYELKLTLPKHVALIGCGKDREDRNKGIFYFENFKNYHPNAKMNFQFAILKEEFKNNIEEYKHTLPLKFFVLQAEKKNTDKQETIDNRYVSSTKIDLQEEESIINWCWRKWLEHKTDKKEAELHIYFEQTGEVSPTIEWKGIQNNFQIIDKSSVNIVAHGSDRKIDISFDDKKHNILFDRHGKLISEFPSNNEFVNDNFWEFFDKNNPDFNIIFNADTRQIPFVLPYEMMIASMSRVLIIDERVAEVSQNKIKNAYINRLVSKGFKYCDEAVKEASIFDACWAAGIHITTSLTYNDKKHSVSNNLNLNNYSDNHYLNIIFENDGKINSKTNLIKTEANEKNNCEMLEIDLIYDCIVIHRTKLKELIDLFIHENINFMQIIAPKLFVVTGGGVVDFLNGTKDMPVILTTNILKDYLLAGRIAKLSLMKNLK